MVLQATGGAVDTPLTTFSCAHPSLVALSPRPVSQSVQWLHKALGGQGHAALVALERSVVAVVSPGEIGTGFCTFTTGPVSGSTCGDDNRVNKITFIVL